MAKSPKELLVAKTLGNVAHFFGVDERTVKRRRQQLPQDGYDPGKGGAWNVREFARWIAFQRAGTGELSGDLARRRRAEADLMEARREKIQLGLAKSRGELIEFAATRQWVSQHILTIKDRLLGIPTEVAQHVPQRHRSDVEQVVGDRIKRTLTEFAESKPPRETAVDANDEGEPPCES